MKLSLALIVAPTDDEAKKLNNCLASVGKHVDEICITITGKNKKVEEVAAKHKAKVSHFEWVDDFAAARNFNFAQCTGDWILWLDADDILQGGEKLKDFIKETEQVRVVGLQIFYEYGHTDTGTVTDGHWKTQLVKNDGHAYWKGAIHEDLLQKRQVTWAQLPKDEVLRIHTSTKKENNEHFERNLRILEKVRKEEPEEPRTYIYLGRTYLGLSRYQDALEVLSTFVKLSGWDEERYEAKCLMGECYEKLGLDKEALTAYSDALLEDERCPKAYVLKARVYLRQERYQECLALLTLAKALPDPKPGIMHLPTLVGRDLYAMAAICNLHLGNFAQANKLAKEVEKLDPRSKESQELVSITQEMHDDEEMTKTFILLFKWYETHYPNLMEALASSLPPSIKDDPRLQKFYRKDKEWNENSIAIFCGMSAESWLPGSENTKGIGGSETAVIELSKRLVKLGWDVTVYNDCAQGPEGAVIDGVHYLNHWQFNFNDKFNVLWLWRMPGLLDFKWNAKKVILDMHDISSKEEFTPERIANVDKIFVKTKYHRSLYPDVPDEKFVIIGNGIDLSRFDLKVERNPHKLIYSSAPNRGLENLLSIWPQVREAVNDAELHIFYGWKTFYELEKDNPAQMEWMQKMQQLMEQPGVVNHGRVGQKELAKEMLSSAVWAYMTEFPEIDCITAREMQAAGVWSVTTGYAALEETQKSGCKIPGDPKTPEVREQFAEEIIRALTSPISRADIRFVAQDFSWREVANKWNHELRLS